MNNSCNKTSYSFNRAILILIALFMGIGISSAVGFINKDRQWHYGFAPIYTPWAFDRARYVMQFGADTVVDGKTYTKCCCTEMITRPSDNDQDITIVDSIPSPVTFLMREEGSKLYVHKQPNNEGYYNRYREWPYEEPECLLYDFSLGVGESYKSIDSFLRESLVTVDSVYSWKGLDGIDRKCQRVTYKLKGGENMYAPQFQLDFIEGYGPAIQYGWFGNIQTAIITGWQPYSPPYPTGNDQAMLEKITDLKGNVLFRSTDYWNINPDLLMPEDRVWYYHDEEHTPSGSVTGIDYQMQFVGRDTVANREYRLFKTVKSTYISYSSFTGETIVREEGPDEMKPFYMYSVGDRVYVNTQLGAMPEYCHPVDVDTLALVYDFGVDPGDQMAAMTNTGRPMSEIVTDRGSVALPTGRARAYNLPVMGKTCEGEPVPFNTIMGIGNQFGCFPFYDAAIKTGASAVNPKAPFLGMNTRLVKVTDKKGNLIFESEFGKIYTGLQEIGVDTTGPTKYFNLQGMEISQPEVGQLVIIRQGSKATKTIFK